MIHTPPGSAADETEMFRGIVTSSRSAVVATDAEGSIVWANRAAESMFGWPPGELVGHPYLVTIAESARPDVAERRDRLVAGDTDLDSYVARGVRRDGGLLDVEVTPGVRRDATGQVLGTSLIMRDVTEELRLKRELTEAVARSQARFDHSGRPQTLLALDGTLLEVNDAACRLLGWSREELLGHDIATIISPIDLDAMEDQLARLLRGDISAAAYETTGTHKDGHRVPLMIDLTVVRDADGTAVEYAGVARDLTEVVEATARADATDRFFRAIYRRSSDAALVSDAHGQLSYVSPAFHQLLGYSAEQLSRLRDLALVHPDDRDRARAALASCLAEPGRTEVLVLRLRDARGRWRWFEERLTNCVDDPDIGGVVRNLREVSAEMRATEALRVSAARHRAIVENAQEGIVALDHAGTVLFANRKITDLLGVPIRAAYPDGFLTSLQPDQAALSRHRLRNRGTLGTERYEVGYDHPDGTHRIFEVVATPLLTDDGSSLGSLGMVSDVTASREAEQELRHRALHDALTGLPNRSLLVDRLTMAAARQQRQETRGLAVLFLDLDHFKLVNDSRGHDAGDRLLVDVAARIERAVRETDTVARLAGDEFAVVCEDTDAAGAEEVAARIQSRLREPFRFGGEHIYISASIGLALSPPHPVSELLRLADAAMYDAKTSGSGQVATFDGALTSGAQRRLRIVAAVREAMDGRAVALGYQPIIDLDTRRLVGLEALLRWDDPVLGPIPPAEVVAAAETSGLSFELDRAVIRTAARELVRLRERSGLGQAVYVSVNICPRTAQQQRLADLVEEVLDTTGLPSYCLALEITENAIMDHAEHAGALLGRLARRGIRVAIDDFGTGYNSLVQLQRLPVDVLKIDRAFVTDIATRLDSLAITRSIIGLATAVGMRTVAEGIETEEQVATLLELGCHAGQGFLWGPVLSAEALDAAIGTWLHPAETA
ncbi:MAG: PAS domain S-box protein [Nocardioidaceae bacterium]